MFLLSIKRDFPLLHGFFFHQGRVNRMKAQKLIKAQVVRVWQRGAEEKMRISKWCLRVFLSCLSIEERLKVM